MICQNPIKIKTDSSLVAYFDCQNASNAASKALSGKQTTFGVMQAMLVKTEDEGEGTIYLINHNILNLFSLNFKRLILNLRKWK